MERWASSKRKGGRWNAAAALRLVGLGALVALLCPAPCRAEPARKALALPDISSANGPLDLRPALVTMAVLKAPSAEDRLLIDSPLAKNDGFYAKFIGGTDERLTRAYEDRWWYHEMQGEEDRSRWGNKHVDIGSLDFYNAAPSEADARKSFAMQALRIRVETTVRQSLRRADAVRALQRTEKVLASQQATVKLGQGGYAGSELRIGYNLLQDQSRIEVASLKWRIGVYHALMRTFGGISYAQAAYTPGPYLVSPAATYRLDNQTLELSVTKALSRSMATTLSTVSPMRRNGVESSLGLSFRYGF